MRGLGRGREVEKGEGDGEGRRWWKRKGGREGK